MMLNAFVFRSYNVVGVSMENTLHGDDRIIVNRLAVRRSILWGANIYQNEGKLLYL